MRGRHPSLLSSPASERAQDSTSVTTPPPTPSALKRLTGFSPNAAKGGLLKLNAGTRRRRSLDDEARDRSYAGSLSSHERNQGTQESESSLLSDPKSGSCAAQVAEQIAEMQGVFNSESSQLYLRSLVHDQSSELLLQSEAQLADVLDELLTTEANYLRDLHVVLECFALPMQDMLSLGEHETIFSNLAALVALHTRIESARKASATMHFARRQAEKRPSTTDAANMGIDGKAFAEAFVEHAPYFECYGKVPLRPGVSFHVVLLFLI